MDDFDLIRYCQKYRDTRDQLISTYSRLAAVSKEKENLERSIYDTEQEIREMQKVITSSIDSGKGPTELLLSQTDDDKTFRSNLWSRIAASFAKKSATPDQRSTPVQPTIPIYEIQGPIATGQRFVFDGNTIKKI